MKFIRLEIENIASIASASIDFSAEPLKSATLFLISGETGVGKTTLLDAIALALYNTAPRLEDMGSRKFVDTASAADADDADSAMRMADSRLLMRRGSMEASVSLTFTGNDGDTYRAVWEVHRAARTKRMQRVQHTLENMTRGRKWGGLRDVAAAVTSPSVTGMDFAQFVRTTMLAQGEFTRFLMSEDNEKAAILEKITGIDRFTRIGDAINRLAAASRERYKATVARLDGVFTMSADERAARQSRLRTIAEAIAANNAAMAAATARRDWLVRRQSLTEACARAQAEREAVAAEEATEAHAGRRRLIDEWEAAAPQMRILDGINRDLRRADESRAAMAGATALYAGLQAAADECASRMERDRALLNDMQKRLNALTPHGSMLDHAAELASRLRRLAEVNRLEAGAKATSAAIERDELPRLQSAHDSAAKIAAMAGTAARQAQTDSDNHAKDLERLDEPGSRRSLEAANTRRSLLDSALALVKARQELETEATDAATALKSASSEAAAAAQALATARTVADERQRHHEAARTAADKAFNAVGDHARALRSVLSVGDSCPVCGHTVDHIPSGEQLLESLTPLKTMAEKARADLDSALADLAKSQTAATAATAAEAAARTLARQTAKAAETGRINRDQALLRASTTESTIASDIAANAAETERLSATVARIDDVRKSQHQAADTLAKALKRKSEADIAVQRAASAIEVANARLRAIAESIRALSDERDTLLKSLNDSLTLDNATADPEPTARRIELMADERRSLTDSRAATENRLAAAADLLARARRCLGEAATALPRIAAAAGRQRHAAAADIIETASRLSADISVITSMRADIAARLTDARRRIAACEGGLTLSRLRAMATDSARAAVELARRECESLGERRRQAEAALRHTQTEIEAHDSSRPAMEADTTADTCNTIIAQTNELNTALLKEQGSIDSELRRDSESRQLRAALIEEMERAKEEHDGWQILDDNFGGSGGMRFSRLAQSHILASLLHNANYYLRSFTPRYTMSSVAGQLQVLISDNDNGGDLRPFNTLSGGERFMVSLALALGLSSVQKVDTTADTLFIDEGFGTLSRSCLREVMDTLSALRLSEGRRVGIISHVEAMGERIGVHINVERTDGTRATVRVSDSAQSAVCLPD